MCIISSVRDRRILELGYVFIFIYLASPNYNLFVHEYIKKIIRQGDHYSITNYSGSLIN